MPVIKSAKKKLRKDILRTKRNKILKDLFKKAVKSAKKLPSDKTIREAASMLDKAVKNNLIHKNKAARIKSKLSKLVKKSSRKPTPLKSKPAQKPPRKI